MSDQIQLLDFGEFAPRQMSWERRLKISRAKLGQRAKGKNVRGPRNWRSLKFRLRSPEGRIYKGKNLLNFARRHGLHYSTLRDVYHRRGYSCQGWTLPKSKPPQKFYRKYRLYSPDGILHEGENVYAFCKQHNLDPGNVHSVLDGTQSHHKGWRLDLKEYKEHLACADYRFVSPDGRVFEGSNLKKFARIMGLDPASLWSVHIGVYQHHRGWRLDDRDWQPTSRVHRFALISPAGEIHSYESADKSAAQFAREQGLDPSRLYRLIRGEIAVYKGWRRYEPESSKIRCLS